MLDQRVGLENTQRKVLCYNVNVLNGFSCGRGLLLLVPDASCVICPSVDQRCSRL